MMTPSQLPLAQVSPMKPSQPEEQARTPGTASEFDPHLLHETQLLQENLQRQLERPLGLNASAGRIRARQREIVDLLLGEDPLALPARVALLDEVLLDFEAANPAPLASLHPWKQNGLRSYLLTRGELVKASWLLGDRDSALEEQAMLLELDPGNHFFQREQMLTFLLAMEDWESLSTELNQEHRGRKEGLLLRLLKLAIALGEGKKAEAELQAKALRISNPQALAFWSGRKELPLEIPLEAEDGSREESVLASSFLRPFTPQDLYASLVTLASFSESTTDSRLVTDSKTPESVSTQMKGLVREQLQLADDSIDEPQKRLHHLRQALRKAESRIDPATFARSRGRFSDREETSDYLVILLRLGLTLFEAGKIHEARAHLGRMLDLDQADALGARAYLEGMREKPGRRKKDVPKQGTAS